VTITFFTPKDSAALSMVVEEKPDGGLADWLVKALSCKGPRGTVRSA
jgi:hypothetical protein